MRWWPFKRKPPVFDRAVLRPGDTVLFVQLEALPPAHVEQYLQMFSHWTEDTGVHFRLVGDERLKPVVLPMEASR